MATNVSKWLKHLGYTAQYVPDIARPRWQVRPLSGTDFNVATCSPRAIDDDVRPGDPSPLYIEIAKLASRFESLRGPLVVVAAVEKITDRCLDDVSDVFSIFPNLSAVSLALEDSHTLLANPSAKHALEFGVACGASSV